MNYHFSASTSFLPKRSLYVNYLMAGYTVQKDKEGNLVQAPDEKTVQDRVAELRSQIAEPVRRLSDLQKQANAAKDGVLSTLKTPLLKILAEIETLRQELADLEANKSTDLEHLQALIHGKRELLSVLEQMESIMKGWEGTVEGEEKTAVEVVHALLSLRKALKNQQVVDERQWNALMGGLGGAADILKRFQIKKPAAKTSEDQEKKSPDQIRLEENKERNKLTLQNVTTALGSLLSHFGFSAGEMELNDLETRSMEDLKKMLSDMNPARNQLEQTRNQNGVKKSEVQQEIYNLTERLSESEEAEKKRQNRFKEVESSMNAQRKTVESAEKSLKQLLASLQETAEIRDQMYQVRNLVDEALAPMQVFPLEEKAFRELAQNVQMTNIHYCDAIRDLYLHWKQRFQGILAPYKAQIPEAWTPATQTEEKDFLQSIEARKKHLLSIELAEQNPSAAIEQYFVVEDGMNVLSRLLDKASAVFSKVVEENASNPQLVKSDRSLLEGFYENILQNEKSEAIKGIDSTVASFSPWFDEQVEAATHSGALRQVHGLPAELETTLKKDLAGADRSLVEAVIFPALQVIVPGNTLMKDLESGKTVNIRVEEPGQAPQTVALKMLKASDKTSIDQIGVVTEYQINGRPVSAAANGEKNPFQLLQQLFESFVEKRYETRQWKVEITTV